MNNMTMAEKVQVVINTLGTLDMPMTYDNVNHMTGIYNVLFQVRDQLKETEAGAGSGAEVVKAEVNPDV